MIKLLALLIDGKRGNNSMQVLVGQWWVSWILFPLLVQRSEHIAFTIIVPKDNDKDSNLKNEYDDDGDKGCLLYMCWEAPWVPANSPAAPDLKKFVSCNSGLTYLLTELKEEKEPILEVVLRNIFIHSWMGLTHVILEPPAFQKHSICWVFQAFFCSTFFYMYFATRPRPALTAVTFYLPI